MVKKTLILLFCLIAIIYIGYMKKQNFVKAYDIEYKKVLTLINDQKEITGPIIEDDYVFYKLKLQQPVAKEKIEKGQIESIFGKPINIVTKKQKEKFLTKDYIYPDFKITTYINDSQEEKLDEIYITGKNVKTNRGIRVGDSEKKVLIKYGNKKKLYNSYCYQLWPKGPAIGEYAIQFNIKNGIVESIMYYIAQD